MLKTPIRRIVRGALEAYFDAIESALGLAAGALWTSDQGKAFAGYAPVLAAVGTLIADLDNFQDLSNKLKAAGAKQAWEVIDTVLGTIIDREQTKFRDNARGQLTAPLPAESYDMREQLTLLSQFVHEQPLQGSGRIRLIGPDQERYRSMVALNIPDHPFVRHREFGNPVLGSVVMAHAIEHDLLRSVNLERTASISRQPFIWRAISQNIKADSLIDGRYVGYILNSFWNDPIQSLGSAIVHSTNDGEVEVFVSLDGQKTLSIRTLTPLVFYAQIKNCDVDVTGLIKLAGDGPQSATVFFARGTTTMLCSEMEVDADSIRFDGNVWFEAERVSVSPRLRLRVLNGAKVGWGGDIAERYPWNEITPNLLAPYAAISPDPLTSFIGDCAKRFPPAGTLTLNPDLSVPTDDPRVRWIRRQFATEFPKLIKLMIEMRIASSEPMDASGTGKVRVRFEFTWNDLFCALKDSDRAPKLTSFIVEARRLFHA